jgi:hypothetical protein
MTTEEEFIWNFAFGSNMSSQVLTGRRKIKPIESIPGTAQNWRVSFMPFFPYIEPGMGTIVNYKQC